MKPTTTCTEPTRSGREGCKSTTTTTKYINAVKKSLKDKYGEVRPEWSHGLKLLQDNLDLYYRCKDSVDEEGLMLKAKNGSMTKHPLLKIQFDALVQVRSLLTEFGLTPKSAKKVMEHDLEDEELSTLLGG